MGFLRPKSEDPKIDLTPMVDVVFLLLIFFMISTTFVETPGISIRLPSSSSMAQPREPGEVKVSVTAEGAIFHHDRGQLNGITLEELDALLKHYREGASKMTFLLLADRDSRHGRVVEVMDLAREAGFGKLAIGTEKERDFKP